MNKLISILASTVIAVSAMMTTSGTIKTSADADAFSAATEKTTYTIQDVRHLQGFILAEPVEEDLTGKPYDLNGDDRWDVYDLCLMRREVLKNPNTAYDNDTLVIYFSRTGNTEKIAEYLIDITNADSYVIEAAVPYSDADIKYQDDNCRANKEQNDKSVRPEIANPIASIDSYDTIFLGYPIWWEDLPMIVYSFIEKHDWNGKTVIPFNTHEGSGNAGTYETLKTKLQGATLKGDGFNMSGSIARTNEGIQKLDTWLESL